MAYQISFDLEENATQEFLSKVSSGLPSEPTMEEPKEDAMEVEQVRTKIREDLHGGHGILIYRANV
jgi:26S proteasome regulatory subunit N2